MMPPVVDDGCPLTAAPAHAIPRRCPAGLSPHRFGWNLLQVNDVLTIWQIADGKPGHESQSLGLIEAMGRLRPCTHRRIDVAGAENFWSRSRVALNQASSLPVPDLILGCGHATHFPLWRLRRKYSAFGVVLMKPSLPLRCFDLCLVPRHDFRSDPPEHARLLVTEGALNRVVAGAGARSGGLILLGGPSRTHGWDAESMLRALSEVTASGEWRLTDSRRTPEGFVQRVCQELPGIEIHPHPETTPDWVPRALQQAEDVWVTEDSVSMTYEALSSGARVGVLPVPRLRANARVLRGLDGLIAQGRLSGLEDWREAGGTLPGARPLREADRCAQLLIEWLRQARPGN